MEDRYKKIFKYVRSDFNIAGFDMPVFIYLAGGFYFALLNTSSIVVSVILIAFIIYTSLKIQDLKDAKLRGTLKQLAYRFGLLDSTLKSDRIPPSFCKEFIG